ncbi:hypothetical protein GCM10009579_88630 [Streptomyces javensis]|uniref:Transposase n=1 Tax=Streptomyces javensis TaxID=114698 RepID=A0ABN1XEG4_9ACTN
MNRPTRSMASLIGVPPGGVTEKAADSGPVVSRNSAMRSVISAIASSRLISFHSKSRPPRGVVRRSGRVSRAGLCRSSGAARPFGRSAVPVGWSGSGRTRTIAPDWKV